MQGWRFVKEGDIFRLKAGFKGLYRRVWEIADVFWELGLGGFAGSI